MKKISFFLIWMLAVANVSMVYGYIETVSGVEWAYEVEDNEVLIAGTSQTGGELNIPSTLHNGLPVTVISDGAFDNCEYVTSISIPDSVYAVHAGIENTKILENSDDGFVIVDGWLFGIKGACPDGLMIPDGVKGITARAFSECEKIVTVTFSDSVKYINHGAFDGCSSLKEVTLSNNLLHIDSYAFRNCRSLTSITIPGNVKEIWYYAFSGCSSLESVIIPDSVTGIGEAAFAGCSSLMSITIPDSVTWIGWRAFDGTGYVNSHPTGVVILDGWVLGIKGGGPSVVALPQGTRGIAYSAFNNCDSLTSITIPDSVKSIGGSAFADCDGLTSVSLGNGVTSIGNYAFSICSGLTSITIPDSVINIDKGAFSDCRGLTSITIPDSVTSIGDYAFSGCSGLTSITIPDSVISIDEGAFSGCSSLMSITIPDSVTSIGDRAFENCGNLTLVEMYDTLDYGLGYAVFFGCEKLKDIYLYRGEKGWSSVYWVIMDCSEASSATIKVIGDIRYNYTVSNGNANITGLANWAYPGEDVYIPSIIGGYPVTRIEQYAFKSRSITSIIIPDSISNMEHGVFMRCGSLKSVVIGNGLDSIPGAAFMYCGSLESITIPDSVTKIEESAFAYSGLVSVNFGAGLEYIEDEAFLSCENLVSISVSDSVKTIGNSAFSGCNSLETVFMGNGITEIGRSIFENCENLSLILCPEDLSYNVNYLTFGNTACVAYYHVESKEIIKEWSYKAVEQGVIITGYTYLYGDIIIPTKIDDKLVVGVTESVFAGGRWITSVYLPEGIYNVEKNIFSGCALLKKIVAPYVLHNNSDNLSSGNTANIEYYGYDYSFVEGGVAVGAIIDSGQEVVIPGMINNYSVVAIADNAFTDRSDITHIVIPESVTKIGDFAFAGCSGLTSISISTNVVSIGHSAFKGCVNISSIIIPDNVTDIEYGAFRDCSGLESVILSDNLIGIGNNIFTDCNSIKSIKIPQIVLNKGIGNVFPNYKYITNISLTDGVTDIPDRAFYECERAEHIRLSENVKNVGKDVFSGCFNLKEIGIPVDSFVDVKYISGSVSAMITYYDPDTDRDL